MDQTLKALVRYLEEGKPELKIAATQVLGELAPKDAAVAKALAERLSREESFLTPFVLEALGRIHTPESVAVLVERLHVGGTVAERVTHLLTHMGGGVVKALAPMFDGADAELRDRILSIVGGQRDKDAVQFLLKALLHHDPAISEKAREVMAVQVDEFGEKERAAVKSGLDKALAANKVSSLTPVAIADAVGVLGRLDAAGSRATLLRFATPKHEGIVRQAALRALEDVALTPAQAATVVSYVKEDDMTHVVRPAMQVLDGRTEWNASAGDTLGRLLDSDSEERALFALRALRGRRTEAMANHCLKFLFDDEAEFQRAAAEALAANSAALKPLLKALQGERSVDRARLLSRPLAALAAKLTAAQLKSLIEKTAKLVTAGEPMGDVYLSVVAAAPDGPGQLVDKAVRLRRARRVDEALTLMIRLAQLDRLPDEGRYQIGVARLMADAAESRPAERKEAGDATMGYFAHLIRADFPLFERLKKEGQLRPEDLLRVGRHFAEGVAQERRVGGQLLHLVAQKHGKQRVGEEAKLMLRTEGL